MKKMNLRLLALAILPVCLAFNAKVSSKKVGAQQQLITKNATSMNSKTAVKNGVNLDQLQATVNLIKEDPEIANFKFKAQTEWVVGGYCRTKISDFSGAKMDDASQRTEGFVLEGDEPAILLGTDKGPNAVESVLHAMSSCLSVGIVYNAAVRDIQIKSLSFSMEGELDLHGFLGLSEETRPGYKDIQVVIDLEADADQEEIADLIDYVKKTSPVLDIITNPVPVTLSFN